MSRSQNTTVHRYSDGTINMDEADAFDLWVKRNSGKIRVAIADIHDKQPSMRQFNGENVGPLVYALYERRGWAI